MIATLLLTFSLSALAGTIELTGRIYEEVNIVSDDIIYQLKFNHSHYFDYELVNGKAKRRYFQSNEVIELEKSKIKKVTILAP